MSASSNGVKNGFFGYIKGLFRKDDAAVALAEYDNTDTAEVATLPLSPPPVEVAYAAQAPVGAAPAAPVNDNLDSRDAGVAPVVGVSLQPILDGLRSEERRVGKECA